VYVAKRYDAMGKILIKVKSLLHKFMYYSYVNYVS
jgi:hypothetical protein